MIFSFILQLYMVNLPEKRQPISEEFLTIKWTTNPYKSQTYTYMIEQLCRDVAFADAEWSYRF